MSKRTTILIISVCLIIFITILLSTIPVVEWNALPYIFLPLGIAALIATVGITVQLVRKPKLTDAEKLDGGKADGGIDNDSQEGLD